MIFILSHDEARRRAQACIASAPQGYVVRVEEPSKSREQEEKYHAIIGEIADAFTYHGRKLDRETMKRMLIDQFRADTKDDPELAAAWKIVGSFDMLPSLDGARVVMLGPQSRRFPKVLASAFIEWLESWRAQHE